MDNYYLRLKCYHCGSIMEAWDHSAGKRSRCPKCDAPLKVPHFKYFEQFNGKKVLAGKIDDWNKDNKWKPEDHPIETPQNSDPIVYAKETDEGVVIDNQKEKKADDVTVEINTNEITNGNSVEKSATIQPITDELEEQSATAELDFSAAGAGESEPTTESENKVEKADLTDKEDSEENI